MPTETPPTPSAPPREQVWHAYHALALLPAFGMLGGLTWANRVHPMILGLPFLMAWLVAWVLATAGIMALILRLDRDRGLASDAAPGDETGKAT